MWCKNCRQDVPALALATGSAARCPQCGGRLRHAEPAAVTVHTAGLERDADSDADRDGQRPDISEPDTDFDDWALDVELQRLQRLVSGGQAAAPSPPPPVFTFPLPVDTNSQGGAPAPVAECRESNPTRPRASMIAWALLGGGVMAFVCGAVLLAWSLIAARGELWTLGMPICLAGQLGLLLGLVFQLTKLWDDHRRAASQLATVDVRLADLNRSTTLLTAAAGTPGQSFYANMVRGANPQILVADLKGQLDLLALQIASGSR